MLKILNFNVERHFRDQKWRVTSSFRRIDHITNAFREAFNNEDPEGVAKHFEDLKHTFTMHLIDEQRIIDSVLPEESTLWKK